MVKQLQKWAELKNYPVMGDVVVAQGLPCTLGYSFMPANSLYTINVPVTPNQWSKELQKNLKGSLKGIKGFSSVSYNKKDDNIIVLCKSSMMGGANKLFGILQNVTDALVPALQQNNLIFSDTCRFCKQTGCDTFMTEGQNCFPAHTPCKTEQAKQILAQINENVVYGNYFTGIICGIVGAIVGCIPTIFTIMSMNTIYGMLFALIPLASYYGYKFGKGILSKAVPFVIAAVSLVITFVMFLSVESMLIFNALKDQPRTAAQIFGKVPASFLDCFSMLSHPLFKNDVIFELAQALLFCVVGIVLAWSIIRRSNVDLVKQAKELDSSIAAGDVAASVSAKNSSESNSIDL